VSLTPFYKDWQFWSTVIACLALVLSQFPPVLPRLRPRRLEIEVLNRIVATHKVGNPNMSLYVSIRNTGGRDIRVRGIKLALWRDGHPVATLPAQNYFETPSSKSHVLLVPFTLKAGDSWAHTTNFLNYFDRPTEKLYRESESLLVNDLTKKIKTRRDGEEFIPADPTLIEPFLRFFERFFIWLPGEYVAELSVTTESKVLSKQGYRFTLFESDTAELRSYTAEYRFGGGIKYDVDAHAGVGVPISPLSQA